MILNIIMMSQTIFTSLFEASIITMVLKKDKINISHFLISWAVFFCADLLPDFVVTIIPMIYTLLCFFLLNHFLYKQKISMVFIAFGCDIFLQVIDELLLMFLCLFFFNIKTIVLATEPAKHFESLIVAYIIMDTLLLCSSIIFNIIISKIKKETSENSTLLTLITSFTCMCCFVLSTVIYPQHNYIASCIFVLILIIITIISFLHLIKQNKNKAILELELERNTALLNNNEEIRKIHHDISNHLYTIQSLLDRNCQEEVYEYATALRKEYEHNPRQYSKNTLIDTILSNKLSTLEDIEVSCDIHLPSSLPFQSYSLATLLFNLLDNSIEACHRNTNGNNKIDIVAKIEMNQLLISITNTVNPNEESITNTIKKSKNHGYGLINVKNIVKKFHGSIKTNRNHDTYNVIVLLPM